MIESLTGSSRRTDVSFHRDGHININANVAKKLCLDDGDVIDIGRDGVEFYLYVRLKNAQAIGSHHCRCTRTKKRSCNFRAYSKQLCLKVLDIVGCSDLANLNIGHAASIDGRKGVVLIMRNRT